MVSSQSHDEIAAKTYFENRAKAIEEMGRAGPFEDKIVTYDWREFSSKHNEMWDYIAKLHNDHLERLEKAEVKNISLFPLFFMIYLSLSLIRILLRIQWTIIANGVELV